MEISAICPCHTYKHTCTRINRCTCSYMYMHMYMQRATPFLFYLMTATLIIYMYTVHVGTNEKAVHRAKAWPSI